MKIFMLLSIILAAAAVFPAQPEKDERPVAKAFFYQSLAWSADGKSLAVAAMSDYDAGTDEYRSGIFVMGADGSNARKVSGEAKHAFSPAWSGDGKRIFFGAETADGKESDIFSVRRDGTQLVRLTKNVGRSTAPSVSPDGQKIAFMSAPDGGKYQIYVIRRDGSRLTKITADAAVSSCSPVWSKDGKELVFYTDKGDRKDQIWIMNADGSNKKRLTNGSGHNIFPSFAAGGRIIFSRRDDRDAGQSYVEASFLYTINADGSGLRKLSDLNSFFARVSPDGKRLAFVAGKFPANAVYTGAADGSGIIKLTN